MEWREGEQMITQFSFLGELTLKVLHTEKNGQIIYCIEYKSLMALLKGFLLSSSILYYLKMNV